VGGGTIDLLGPICFRLGVLLACLRAGVLGLFCFLCICSWGSWLGSSPRGVDSGFGRGVPSLPFSEGGVLLLSRFWAWVFSLFFGVGGVLSFLFSISICSFSENPNRLYY